MKGTLELIYPKCRTIELKISDIELREGVIRVHAAGRYHGKKSIPAHTLPVESRIFGADRSLITMYRNRSNLLIPNDEPIEPGATITITFDISFAGERT